MAERRQFIRQTLSEANQFTGLLGEITYETQNKELRIHDGITQGGYRVPTRDANDLRYQAKSVELTALAELNDDPGFLVRTTTATYVRRTLQGTDGQITVTYGDGITDDPTFTLPDDITKALTFSGGITGNVTGNLTGNVTGNVTGDLTGDSAGTHTGSVDATGATVTVDDAEFAISKIDGLQAILDNIASDLTTIDGVLAGIFQASMIMMWSGSIGSIPTGWQLCNGTNGTPDLRDKFVVGAGSTYTPGDSGGAATHIHSGGTTGAGGDHTHTLTIAGHELTTAEMPSHSHLLLKDVESTDRSAWATGTKYIAASRTTGDSPPRYGLSHSTSTPDIANSGSAGSGNSHTHSGSTAASSGDHTHSGGDTGSASSLPPYYALCFIAYVGT